MRRAAPCISKELASLFGVVLSHGHRDPKRTIDRMPGEVVHQGSLGAPPNEAPPLPKEDEIIFSLGTEAPEDPTRCRHRGSSRRRPPEHEVDIHMPGGDGAFLTWEDLTVVAADSNGARRTILQGASGYAEPGRVLAIMGPSGCGKSTLLDALAGRLQSNVQQSGIILANGRRQALSFGTSAYVTQDDILMSTLTVREAIYYSAQLQLPNSMAYSEKIDRAEKAIEAMGLQDAKETRIGGYSSKGLSGGQKRRVSICIEILTRPKLLFLDEPTSGLDSAASFHIMNHITKLGRHEKMTILASIHQPSTEVFQLFDNICLLSSGKTIFFGSTSRISEFFAENGFPCPTMRNPSDHFLRIINKDFDKEVKEERTNTTISTIEVISSLAASFKASSHSTQVLQHMSDINGVEGRKLKKGSQASFLNQCIILTKRSFKNMTRDIGYYWFRLVMYLGVCITLGTLFYDIGHTYGSIQARGSLLFFISAFLTFMAISGFPSFVEDMKVFRRERLNGHYGVAAFIIGNTISSSPYIGLISIIPATFTYFLTGLQRSFEHYIFFVLVLYTTMLLVESLMMVVATLVSNFLIGIVIAAGIQAIMMLCCGFFRLPNDIPKPVWKYPFYHLAYHKYGSQAYYKNEFIGLNFPSNQGNGAPVITGKEVIKDFWQMEQYSKWVDLVILVGMVIAYRSLFLIVTKAKEKLRPTVGISTSPTIRQPTQIMEQP